VGFDALAPPPGCALGRLDPAVHNRDSFCCGTQALDTFLQTQAAQDQAKSLSASHILSAEDAQPPIRILGYVTLVTKELPLSEAPASITKITRRPAIPVLLLARMAVDRDFQGRHYGEYLLKYALVSADEIARIAGCLAVIVDAKDEKAKQFYVKYGFEPFVTDPLRLFLPLTTIRLLFSR
jgi:GNAT superfamily N-acetyltransferase